MAAIEQGVRFLKQWRGIYYSASRRRAFRRWISSSPLSDGVGFGGVGHGRGGEIHLPVLIVGAGPVGLVLSMLLTKLGIKCAVLEKNLVFSQHPQAHLINNRSMELFQKLDGLADEIQRLQPPVDLWRKYVYCTSLSGSILGSVDHMQPQDFEKIVSPISVAHFPQYKLIELLLRKLENLGFHICTLNGVEGINHDMTWEKKILMGHKCISINPTPEGVIVGASFLKDGKMTERNIHCNILVGTDGARSTVRELVGIEMKGERDLQNLISVHFLSRDLGQHLLHQRPGMLFFIFNTEAIGVLVAHDLRQGEFVLQIPFYPPQQNLEDFSSKMDEIIFKLAGRKLVDLEVVDIKPWVMHAEVAEKFISCDNRVILVGDAAHRFPPAGGFGMNTGVQDAHNLAWKLAFLLNGISSPYILQTYEMERRPIALFNTALSIKNYKAAMSVPAALGLDPTIATSVHRVINSSVSSFLPSGLQKAVLEGIFSIGRAQLSDSFLNEKNPLGSSRLAKLKCILDEGRSLQLQFPAEDLGFRYIKGAVVDDNNDGTKDETEAPDVCQPRSREYIPSSRPGSRLPHMSVRLLDASAGKDAFSTLDLVDGGKLEFLLIIAPKKESYHLAHVAFKVAGEFNAVLKLCVMWPHGSSGEHVNGSKVALEPWKNYIDVEEARSSLASWWEMCQMTSDGAILVRPDDHIAWRAEAKVVGDPAREMERVFSVMLGVKRTIALGGH